MPDAQAATIPAFEALDEGDVLCGYVDGLVGHMPRVAARSSAWWHGWRNAQVDAGIRAPDAAQAALEAALAKRHVPCVIEGPSRDEMRPGVMPPATSGPA